MNPQYAAILANAQSRVVAPPRVGPAINRGARHGAGRRTPDIVISPKQQAWAIGNGVPYDKIPVGAPFSRLRFDEAIEFKREFVRQHGVDPANGVAIWILLALGVALPGVLTRDAAWDMIRERTNIRADHLKELHDVFKINPKEVVGVMDNDAVMAMLVTLRNSRTANPAGSPGDVPEPITPQPVLRPPWEVTAPSPFTNPCPDYSCPRALLPEWMATTSFGSAGNNPLDSDNPVAATTPLAARSLFQDADPQNMDSDSMHDGAEQSVDDSDLFDESMKSSDSALQGEDVPVMSAAVRKKLAGKGRATATTPSNQQAAGLPAAKRAKPTV